MKTDFVQAGSYRLQYFEQGDGDPIVLVHGYRSSGRVWALSQAAFSPKYRSIALSNRGAGDSDHGATPEDYTVEKFAEGVYEAVKSLGLERFVLIGHSMGGATVTQFALDHPEMLRALVLLDPAPLAGRPLTDGWQAQVEGSWRAGTMEPASLQGGQPDDYQTALRADVLRNPLERLIGGRASMASLRLRERLRELAMPVLVVGGDRDDTVGVDNILTEYLALRPAVRSLHVFHGIAHSPNSECPVEFAAVIERWIESLSAGPPKVAASTVRGGSL
jgi:pimeloyl-ACP methyl ester carboxylesterase